LHKAAKRPQTEGILNALVAGRSDRRRKAATIISSAAEEKDSRGRSKNKTPFKEGQKWQPDLCRAIKFLQ
jgi:hypothetical protein